MKLILLMKLILQCEILWSIFICASFNLVTWFYCCPDPSLQSPIRVAAPTPPYSPR